MTTDVTTTDESSTVVPLQSESNDDELDGKNENDNETKSISTDESVEVVALPPPLPPLSPPLL